jgi:glutamine synthetase
MTERGRLMFSSLEQLQSHLQQRNIQMVDLKFSDLWGRWHQSTIPAHESGAHARPSCYGVSCPGSV